MRVTTFSTQERRTAEIMRSDEQLQRAQDLVSSGQRIQKPSDAPDQIAGLLRARSDVAELTRRRDGADGVLRTMQVGETTLNDLTDALRQVRTLTLQANNATTSADQRQEIASQISQVTSRIVSLVNSQESGHYLFGGTSTQSAPFSAGPPVTYTGNGTPLELNLTTGAPFAVSVTGEALLNRRGGTDLFQNLAALGSAIRSGDSPGMSAGLTALDSDLSNVARLNGDLGARVQYVQMARQQTDNELAAASGRQSDLQNADLAQAILEEKTAEVAHQAALAMAGRANATSLLDYLR